MKFIPTLRFVTILAVILQLAFLNAPISRGEGYYLHAGQLILSGKLPYRDYFDHKPPGMHYLVAGLFKLFGESLYVVKYSIFIIHFFSAFLLYLIGRKIWGKSQGALASVIFLVGLPLYNGYFIISDALILFLGAIGLYCYLLFLDNNNLAFLFVSGFFLGISVLFKQTGLLLFIAVLFYHIIHLRHFKSSRVLLTTTLLVAGLALPLVLFIVYLLSQDLYSVFIHSVISTNISSYPPRDFGTFIEYSYKNFMFYPLVWILPVCFVFLPKKTRDKGLIILFLFVVSLSPTTIRQYLHYYIPALGFASILSSVVLIELSVQLSKLRKEFNFIQSVCVLLVLLLLCPLLFNLVISYRLIEKEQLLDDYLEVGAFIKNNTYPTEKILVLTSEPQFYFLSDRSAVNEFTFIGDVNYYEGIEEKLIKDSLDNDVAYFIVVENPRLETYASKVHDFILNNSVLEKNWPGKQPIMVYQRIR